MNPQELAQVELLNPYGENYGDSSPFLYENNILIIILSVIIAILVILFLYRLINESLKKPFCE